MAQPRFRVIRDKGDEEETGGLLPRRLFEDSEESAGSGAESLGPEGEANQEGRGIPPLRLRVVRPGGSQTPSSPPHVRYTNTQVRATAFRPMAGVAPSQLSPPVSGRGRAPLDHRRSRTPETRPRGWEPREFNNI